MPRHDLFTNILIYGAPLERYSAYQRRLKADLRGIDEWVVMTGHATHIDDATRYVLDCDNLEIVFIPVDLALRKDQRTRDKVNDLETLAIALGGHTNRPWVVVAQELCDLIPFFKYFGGVTAADGDLDIMVHNRWHAVTKRRLLT